ncbi:hypothetical protein LJB99_01050 [Deltaproteobacteria bacterium OttesenSCG-928-K17]|nr:hypothetical protein [Deltaproteobacteria bacterium OttesenSCG-928-K17]
MEEKTTEKRNALRRAVAIGLAGFLLCLGFSHEMPAVVKKLTSPINDNAYEEFKTKNKDKYWSTENIAKHTNVDDLKKLTRPDMSEDERMAAVIKVAAEAAAEMFMQEHSDFINECGPTVRKKTMLAEFGLLAGAGFFIALLGLLASAWWTAISSRKLLSSRASALFRAALPHADFNQPLPFSTRNFKELSLWTAAWLAAPLAIIINLADIPSGLIYARPFLSGFYPLAVIVGSFYIFSFWLTLAVYLRRGKRIEADGQYVKFFSPALLCCLFFIYVPLLRTPLDLIFGLLILLDLWRHYLQPGPCVDAAKDY